MQEFPARSIAGRSKHLGREQQIDRPSSIFTYTPGFETSVINP
ncbi:MAG: hypothetical protein ACMG55_11980 [Microcoleus sp.]